MSLRILIIDNDGSGLDWAMRSQADGHDIRWYIRPRKDGQRSEVGDGFVTKIEDYRTALDWCDFVILTDNAFYMKEMDHFRNRGGKVFGPTEMSAELELDRLFGQEALKTHGIPVIPAVEFHSYDDAIRFVKKEGKRYVSKPCGDADKALTYVSKSPADMVYMLERWKKNKSLKSEFLLQEFVPGIEMAIGGWFGPGGWSGGWCENFEFKKLMNDDLGCATGEQGCYSADTEVLTSDGWKFWPEVTINDELATLNRDSLVFEKPSAVVSYDINGEMIQWTNRSIDILVTPSHQMYVAGQSSSRRRQPLFKFVSAEACFESQYRLYRTANFNGNSPRNFTVPGRISRHPAKPIDVPFDKWCWFLGFWFAEGSSNFKQVQLAQSNPRKSALAWSQLQHLPFNIKQTKFGFSISNTALASVLKPFGRSYEKRVPEYIRNAESKDIEAFLDGFALGDAHIQANGSRAFYTSNKGLADDLQELMLRCGRLGIIAKHNERNHLSYINGRPIHPRRAAYIVWERTRKTTSWLDSRDKQTVHYKGKVYCATVSNHLLFVRRNGKPIWCGNTVVRVVKKSKLAEKVLFPITGLLHRMRHTGYIDVNCIIDERGMPWPLEFTSRLGWPLFNIQQALFEGDHAQWMKEILDGECPDPWVRNDIAVGVVMSIPDYPYSHVTNKEVSGIPVYGLKPSILLNCHLCEMRMGSAPVDVRGKVIEAPMPVTAGDYLLVMTGTGQNVKSAKSQTYSRLKTLTVPNSPMYRTDIGNRLKKQIPILQQHGFATGMAWM